MTNFFVLQNNMFSIYLNKNKARTKKTLCLQDKHFKCRLNIKSYFIDKYVHDLK